MKNPLEKTNKNKLFLALCSTLLMAAIVLLLYTVLTRKSPEEVNQQAYSTSVQSAESGDYANSAIQLESGYDTISDPLAKAEKAFDIGSRYFQAGDVTNGEKWYLIAAQGYKELGKQENYQQTLEQIKVQKQLKAEMKNSNKDDGGT